MDEKKMKGRRDQRERRGKHRKPEKENNSNGE
jgi:hypothetical protein